MNSRRGLGVVVELELDTGRRDLGGLVVERELDTDGAWVWWSSGSSIPDGAWVLVVELELDTDGAWVWWSSGSSIPTGHPKFPLGRAMLNFG